MEQDYYLKILAKILNTETEESVEINELYDLVEKQLYNTLENVYFPSMPRLSKRLEKLLLSIKAISVCRQLIGKEVITIYGHYTNCLTEFIKKELNISGSNWISVRNLQIPIIILNDAELKIEAVNGSFGVSELKKRDYKMLLIESSAKHVALNKMVKFFIIRMPLSSPDRCFILDNSYHDATYYYDSVICKKIYNVTQEEQEYIKKNTLEGMDYILCQDNVYQFLSKKKYINGSKQIKSITDDFYDGNYVNVIFGDELNYALCNMMEYYNVNIYELSKQKKELEKDIIRDSDKLLSDFCDQIGKECKTLTKARDTIQEITDKIHNVVYRIDNELSKLLIGEHVYMSKRHKDMLFEYYFSIAGYDKNLETKCIKHIIDLGYDDAELLLDYSKSKNGSNNIRYNGDILYGDWEYAKMRIHFINGKEVTQEIATLIYTIGKSRLTEGNEWYYWGLLNDDDEALKKAVQLDCEMAESLLYYRYNNKLQMDFLAQNLYLPACIEKGKNDVKNYIESINKITSSKLTYYKIAAAMGDTLAIQEIVDILYRNVIWKYFIEKGIPMTEMEDNSSFVEVGKQLLQICGYLLNNKVNTAKNKEISAVIQFCLNQNWSDIHSVFYSSSSDAAYICKGYMFEYGKYEQKNLDKALDRYSKVKTPGLKAVQNAKKRVKAKITTREKQKEDEYSKENDYSGYSSSSTIDSSWCFITTAASCALHKGKDCEELNYLRKFRDEHIKGSSEGDALVKEYYNIAPKIIEKIDAEEEKELVYTSLWTDYIVPSTEQIRQGNWQSAQDIYVEMVVDLSKKYNVPICTEGFEQLYNATLQRIGKSK